MQLQGTGVSQGFAIGRIAFYSKKRRHVEAISVRDVSEELKRFEAARIQAMDQLGELAEAVVQSIGEENARLFEIHRMMLADEDYVEAITQVIRKKGLCAEYAVAEASRRFSAMFGEMKDAYMRARAADVQDISGRLLDILAGREEAMLWPEEPVILAGEDFTPSETAGFPRDKVLALATRYGSENSHTSIFARTLGIPAIVRLGDEVNAALNGRMAVLDGGRGVLYIDPDSDTLKALQEEQCKQSAIAAGLKSFRGKPTRTKGGRGIKLFANIGMPEDADAVLEGDAEGIGLLRSEFLYLGRNGYPDEETQYRAYRRILERMGERQVIIRTLDIGADKQAEYFLLPPEQNPAMGMRAIRICLTRPEVFKTQLRAIYRAAAHGNAAIMFPMITSINEVRRAKAIACEVREELGSERCEFNGNVPIGIMIETPASAIISDLLAAEADFFSVGTNDLTQYTLAADRQNATIKEFCNPRHEAVLRLIQTAAENAHKNGIWIGICGELAGDTSLTGTFLDMGIDELSVPASQILNLRSIIAKLD